MAGVSEHLGRTQLRGLVRLGNVLAPGDHALPRFGATGCVREVDRVLDHIPDQDRSDLRLVLTVLAFVPPLVVRGIWWLIDHSTRMPTPLGSLLRFGRVALKGLVMTLYYDDPGVLAVLGYEVSVATDDLLVEHKD